MTGQKQNGAADLGEILRECAASRLVAIEGLAGLELVELDGVPDGADPAGADVPSVDGGLVPYSLDDLGRADGVRDGGPPAGPEGDAPAADVRLRRAVEQPDQRTAAAPSLTIATGNLARAGELRQAFASAADGSKVGEKLLEDFVGMEAGIALALLDTEAAAVALIQKTLPVDPALALKLAQVAKEVEALSSAVHRRMQNGLAAAANLRAQRHLVAMQRGSHGK